MTLTPSSFHHQTQKRFPLKKQPTHSKFINISNNKKAINISKLKEWQKEIKNKNKEEIL